MIELKTGACLNKELEITDFSDGKRFGPRLGWLMTFHPCRFCETRYSCKRGTCGACEKEYLELWVDKYLTGSQTQLENWGVEM